MKKLIVIAFIKIIFLFGISVIFTACTVETNPAYNQKSPVESKTLESVQPSTPKNYNSQSDSNSDPDSNCHPSYSGCLKADASDYDCAGGSGNGPYYTGKVRVIGPDVFGLDRDNDGWGCE